MSDRLIPVLVETFRCDPAQLSDTAGMADVPGWDSLSHMKLVLAIEQAFAIELTGDEIADLQSIGAIRNALRQRGITP